MTYYLLPRSNVLSQKYIDCKLTNTVPGPVISFSLSNYLYEINFCTGLTTLKTNLIFRISHLALCLWAFFAHWQKVQNKDFRGAIVQKQYVLRGSVKLCFEEHRNLTAKNWLCILYSFVTAQC